MGARPVSDDDTVTVTVPVRLDVEQAARALVAALGQPWPEDYQGTWTEGTYRHWDTYKASWRFMARAMLLAAADPAAHVPPLCGTCGAPLPKNHHDDQCPHDAHR